eukprot:TRINITY_DN1006_c0_g1_i1.p1 TRINITY_DN1006_c0_g1~~TRINITY_DN1006_c0_g1_i1.p1  ORF type:complete len:132 (-),score=24.38 TRINITY_DN1006_c0_g1_i1:76-471(-)
MTKIINVPSPREFDDILNENLKTSKRLFVLVFGSLVLETKQSWCPDCVRAQPLIYDALDKIDDVVLLDCPVIRAEYKGNPEYPYRTHAGLQIKAVPTLIHWTKEGPKERWVEGECERPTLLDELKKASLHD